MSGSFQYLTKCICSNMVEKKEFYSCFKGRGKGRQEEAQLHLPQGFLLFRFVWVVQLESAVFHQANGSQQTVSLTWLT